MKITATANIDGVLTPCTGEIEIHWMKEPQAYITWRLFDSAGLIASRSENYFYKEDRDTEEGLIKRIIERIEKYRGGRKKIFTNVQIVS